MIHAHDDVHDILCDVELCWIFKLPCIYEISAGYQQLLTTILGSSIYETSRNRYRTEIRNVTHIIFVCRAVSGCSMNLKQLIQYKILRMNEKQSKTCLCSGGRKHLATHSFKVASRPFSLLEQFKFRIRPKQ
jgi:hypothetical protein